MKRFQPPGTLSDEEVTRLEMYALRVPRLVLPIRHYQEGGNSNPAGGTTSVPALSSTDTPLHSTGFSGTTPPATGSNSNTTTHHGPQTGDLLDVWYPQLKGMVCAADDASTCSEYASEGQDSISWLQYARLFAGSSAELRTVVEEHDAMEEKARDEMVGRWLRAIADVDVR